MLISAFIFICEFFFPHVVFSFILNKIKLCKWNKWQHLCSSYFFFCLIRDVTKLQMCMDNVSAVNVTLSVGTLMLTNPWSEQPATHSPFKPHFLYKKVGLAGINIIFAQNVDCRCSSENCVNASDHKFIYSYTKWSLTPAPEWISILKYFLYRNAARFQLYCELVLEKIFFCLICPSGRPGWRNRTRCTYFHYLPPSVTTDKLVCNWPYGIRKGVVCNCMSLYVQILILTTWHMREKENLNFRLERA